LQAFVLTLHVIACIVLICLVLLQSGKEGMGVIFGGGSSSVFGSSGAGGLLVKLTAIVATVFLITSLTYNMMTSAPRTSHSGSIMETTEPVEKKAPAVQIEETAPAEQKADAAAPAEQQAPAAAQEAPAPAQEQGEKK
jgi:preprotein translocase subunit SecG